MPHNDSYAGEAAGYDTGKHRGQLWVTKKGASQGELERLEEFWSNLEGTTDWGLWFSDEPTSAYSTAERLFFILAPESDGHRDGADDFWGYVAWPNRIEDISVTVP